MPPPANPAPSSYGQEVSLRRRLVAFAIAVLVNVGLLLMLVFMSPAMLGGRHDDRQLTTFDVPVGQKDKPEHAKQHEKIAPKVTQSAAKHEVKPVVDSPIIPQSDQPTNMILMTREDFAATDISKLPSHAKAAMADAGGPADSQTVDGAGPHGETLYAAEWYRRPTPAETEPFFGHRNIPDGAWAEVACQTMPRFHVDNCVALQDSPPGLHLARALQQAAWQFLVRPPQVNGKYQVGAWVRIHYEFYTVKVDGSGR